MEDVGYVRRSVSNQQEFIMSQLDFLRVCTASTQQVLCTGQRAVLLLLLQQLCLSDRLFEHILPVYARRPESQMLRIALFSSCARLLTSTW